MTETSSNPSETPATNTESADRLGGEVSQLKDDFNRLKEDFRRILNDSMSVARAGGGSAKDSLQGRLSGVQDRGNEAIKSVEEVIHERPLTSLAVAVGVGFLLGKLLD